MKNTKTLLNEARHICHFGFYVSNGEEPSKHELYDLVCEYMINACDELYDHREWLMYQSHVSYMESLEEYNPSDYSTAIENNFDVDDLPF